MAVDISEEINRVRVILAGAVDSIDGAMREVNIKIHTAKRKDALEKLVAAKHRIAAIVDIMKSRM